MESEYLELRVAIAEFLGKDIDEEAIMQVADLKKCHICGHVDLEEYIHENEDGIYCDTCWTSKD